MQDNLNDSTKKHYVEFTPGKDPFEKARLKGARSWILAHIFYRYNKIYVLIVLITNLVTVISWSATSIIMGNMINDLSNGIIDTFIFYILIVLILRIIPGFLRIINTILREVIAQRMERDCRKEFYANLLGKSQSFHEQQQIGDLMARVTDDVRTLNFLISPALSLIFESFTTLIIPTIFVIIFFPTQLIIAPIFFSVLFIISLRSYIKKLEPVTFRLREHFGMMFAKLNETLSGIEVVKGSVQEMKELDKYVSSIQEYRNAFIDQGKIQAKYLPYLLLALTITMGLTHGIILLFNRPDFLLGNLLAYLGLFGQLRFPTQISVFVFSTIRVAMSSAERLVKIMNGETEIDENLGGIEKNLKGKIVFDNVSFSYPNDDKSVLKNINFSVEPGQTLAIVGTTGSGKTTLTKLISRLYDVNEGKIMIDNEDIRDYSLKSLRSQISYIEQDVFLFSDSIFNNISFGQTSSREEVIRVSKEAKAHQFINNFPEQYDSEVGERGVMLSGGERQRIAIARAFLSDPQILILDDSTSAIDSNTEDKIQKAIRNILKDRTTLLITHRLSQIRWADKIIVLKAGEITSMGSHEELLKSSEEYRKIFIKKFDLDIGHLT